MRCVYPDCHNSSRTRGLCHGHYQTMRDRVRKGKADESDLETRGLLLPKGQGGSPAPDSLNAFNIGSEVTGRAIANGHEKLPSDWRCPTCRVPRMGAKLDVFDVVTCANGHRSR